MPDREAILRGLSTLPRIEYRIIDGAEPPAEGLAWRGEQDGVKYWATLEDIFGTDCFVVRTTGETTPRLKINGDFTNCLGKPNRRSSEIGVPFVESMFWHRNRIDPLLPPHKTS